MKRKIIICCLIFLLTISIPGVSLAQKDAPKSYDDLPEDTILCYMFGQPVYKSDVNEDFFVTKDFSIANPPTSDFSVSNHSGAYLESLLPLTHRGKNITAEGQLVSIQFSQNDTFLYLTHQSAQQYASALESSGTTAARLSLLLAAASFYKPIAPVAGVCSLLAGLLSYSRAQFASEIRSYTDNGSGVIIVKCSSRYATLRSVSAWDGRYALRYGTSGAAYTSTVTLVRTQDGFYPWASGGGGGGGDPVMPLSSIPENNYLYNV